MALDTSGSWADRYWTAASFSPADISSPKVRATVQPWASFAPPREKPKVAPWPAAEAPSAQLATFTTVGAMAEDTSRGWLKLTFCWALLAFAVLEVLAPVLRLLVLL